MKIVTQNEEMIVMKFVYRNKFLFQRLLKDSLWYVTYQNHIIAHGKYRHDIQEWINITYK